MRQRTSVVLVSAIAVMVLTTGESTAHGQRPSAPGCATQWGSLIKAGTGTTSPPMVGVRVGRHRCFDRLVFDIAGDAPGYVVRYAEEFSAVGSGNPLPVLGGAILAIDVAALGVRARLPFRLLQLQGPGANSRIVVDVARRW